MATKKTGKLSKEGLVKDLEALGLEYGDVVMMHSNLRALASVKEILAAPDGGMQWLVEALREVLGIGEADGGLLAVPTLTKCFVGYGGAAGLVWHPKKTPSRVGQITNYVRTQPDAARSDHPTHPLAAIGARAEEFCSGHSWRDGATTFDRNGPWGHLVDWDGKVMWLGTTMQTQTMVHALEDWMRLPYMAVEKAQVEDDDGEAKVVDVLMAPSGARDFYGANSKCAVKWEAGGKYVKGKVCDADSQVMGARDFAEWLWNAIKAEPDLLLHDPDEGDEFSDKWRQPTIDHVKALEGSWRRPEAGE